MTTSSTMAKARASQILSGIAMLSASLLISTLCFTIFKGEMGELAWLEGAARVSLWAVGLLLLGASSQQHGWWPALKTDLSAPRGSRRTSPSTLST